MGKHMENIKA